MNSCIYRGQVRHRRFIPHTHAFSYPLFMMYLDLNELPTLFERFWLWSYNKPNIAWFDRKRHSGNSDGDLTTYIKQRVAKQTGIYPAGPVRLLTHLTYFGFGFNPVSFFYCFDDDNVTLNAIVAEVNNTPWNEQHCYVLPIDSTSKGVYRFDFAKAFHVSPFNGMNQQYHWGFTLPAKQLTVHMSVFEEDQLHFDATLNLQQHAIDSASLSGVLFRFPFMTAKVLSAIYYQAFKLWLKRTPTYSHPAKQEAPKVVNNS